ncbi:MAG: molecular chaperone DnaK [Psychromonas sp.]
MHHLNEKQIAQFKLQLNSEIIKVRAKINSIFLQSSPPPHLDLKGLARLSVDALIEFTFKLENTSLKKNIEKLKKLDASLITIEQSMYGLCADCENELSVQQLTEDATLQRCPLCDRKYQKQTSHQYRL